MLKLAKNKFAPFCDGGWKAFKEGFPPPIRGVDALASSLQT